MKKLIGIGVLAIGGIFGYNYLQKKQKEAALRGKKQTLVGVAIGMFQAEKDDDEEFVPE